MPTMRSFALGLLAAATRVTAPLVGLVCLSTSLAAADESGFDLAALRRRLGEADPSVRAAAVRRLAGREEAAALRLVTDTLSDAHPQVRRAAAGVLGISIQAELRRRLLREAPGWRDPVARRELTRTYAAWADGDGRTGLLRALGDRDPQVRAEAARWLGDDLDEAAGRGLLVASSDADGLVRACALDALAGRGARDASLLTAPPFRAGLRDRDPRVRISALEGSVAMGGEAAAYAVSLGLDDTVWSVRLVAAELAGVVRRRDVLRPLVAVLRDPRARVALAAGTSLVRLTGIPFDADPVRWTAWLEAEGATFDPSEAPPRAPPPFLAGTQTAARPRFLELAIDSSNVAFVLDASGSMAKSDDAGGTRWERVCRALDGVLERLGTSAEGNVIPFADVAQPLFERAVRFSPSTRDRVREAMASRRPAGRTALYDGIVAALEDPSIDTVVVLSDGVPSAGAFTTKAEFRAELRRANRWRRARIDVISVGADEAATRWRGVLAEVAKDHGGRLLTR